MGRKEGEKNSTKGEKEEGRKRLMVHPKTQIYPKIHDFLNITMFESSTITYFVTNIESEAGHDGT